MLHCSHASVNTKITFQQKVSVKLGHWGVTIVNLCELSYFTASLTMWESVKSHNATPHSCLYDLVIAWAVGDNVTAAELSELVDNEQSDDGLLEVCACPTWSEQVRLVLVQPSPVWVTAIVVLHSCQQKSDLLSVFSIIVCRSVVEQKPQTIALANKVSKYNKV